MNNKINIITFLFSILFFCQSCEECQSDIAIGEMVFKGRRHAHIIDSITPDCRLVAKGIFDSLLFFERDQVHNRTERNARQIADCEIYAGLKVSVHVGGSHNGGGGFRPYDVIDCDGKGNFTLGSHRSGVSRYNERDISFPKQFMTHDLYRWIIEDCDELEALAPNLLELPFEEMPTVNDYRELVRIIERRDIRMERAGESAWASMALLEESTEGCFDKVCADTFIEALIEESVEIRMYYESKLPDRA